MKTTYVLLVILSTLLVQGLAQKVDNKISNVLTEGSDNLSVHNKIRPPHKGEPVDSKNAIHNTISDSTPKEVNNEIRGDEKHSPNEPKNTNEIKNAVQNAKAFALKNVVFSHHPDSKKNTIENAMQNFAGGSVVNRLNDQRDAKEPSEKEHPSEKTEHKAEQKPLKSNDVSKDKPKQDTKNNKITASEITARITAAEQEIDAGQKLVLANNNAGGREKLDAAEKALHTATTLYTKASKEKHISKDELAKLKKELDVYTNEIKSVRALM